jgi:NAD(P)-dependent dehydrogenase (short-subunit alcohol dehydrogenase family)
MKLAVVTGAGNGIGAVIAGHAAKDGYDVAAWDIDGAAARSVAGRLGNGTAATVDVTDESSVEAALAALPAVPDLLVNNAGIVRYGPLLTLSHEDWQETVSVNLTGTFIAARAVARRMAERGSGAIVNISSVNGVAAAPNAGAYSATKAGIVMLTEHMALEWAPLGIRVNAVAPGLIHAGMSSAIFADEEVRRLRESRVPLGRLGLAEDVSATVLFLASERAAYITGQVVAVDGGLSKAALSALPRPKSVDTVGILDGRP